MSFPSDSDSSALLTLGRGPVARATFEYLRDAGHMRAVVLARPARTSSVVERLRAYGIWYSIDKAIDRVYNRQSAFDQVISRENSIETFTWYRPDDGPAVSRSLVKLGIRTLVVSGFPFILKQDFLSRFETVVNLHPSVLPAYRGPEPVPWGILEGAKSFGVTAHHVDAGIDTGAILASREFGRPLIPLSATIQRHQAAQVPALMAEAFSSLGDPRSEARKQGTGIYRPRATLDNRRRVKRDASA